MGNTITTTQKVNFEDVQWIMKHQEGRYLLINTLDSQNQKCLIKNTLAIDTEVKVINDCMKHGKVIIILYGKNSIDEATTKKYQQLISLGFNRVYIYSGGLFEWLCLQDIYGDEEFPTTIKEMDILKYKPISRFQNNYLKDID